MELQIPGTSVKEFTRVLTCLTKFGEDIRIAATPNLIKLSSYNSTVSAFALFTFEPSFFTRYDLGEQYGDTRALGLSVTGKALCAPFRSRSAAAIEACAISLIEGEQEDDEQGVEVGESRLVIRLLCQHGVTKTHRLTYASCIPTYAKTNRSDCNSTWTAPSRILKEWTDHFHVRTGTGANASGTFEISFYTEQAFCRVTSFGGESSQSRDDPLSSRPLNTEIVVDIDDFENYQIQGTPLISFVLKEFKAVIALADQLCSSITAHFRDGGDPFIIEMEATSFRGTFVLSTTNYDAAAGEDNEPKREQSMSIPANSKPASGNYSRQPSAAPVQSRLGVPGTKQTLFQPLSQSSASGSGEGSRPVAPFVEEDEYDMLDFGEDDFAMMDLVSQDPAAIISRTQAVVLVSESVDNSTTTATSRNDRSYPVLADATPSPYRSPSEENDMGATQQEEPASKKAKWDLFGQ